MSKFCREGGAIGLCAGRHGEHGDDNGNGKGYQRMRDKSDHERPLVERRRRREQAPAGLWSVCAGAASVGSEIALEERRDLLRGNVRALTVVEVHVRGTVDDDEFLVLRSGLGVQLLAVPQRARFAAGDDQERLGEKCLRPFEAVERCRGC